jgi:regulator of protease activity HflC (stomatin/prohibitin superfamily)
MIQEWRAVLDYTDSTLKSIIKKPKDSQTMATETGTIKSSLLKELNEELERPIKVSSTTPNTSRLDAQCRRSKST